MGRFSIRGGFIYFGQGLRGHWGGATEPALINPALPVATSGDYRSGVGMPYWPSFSDISPACRASYLEWLADGRCAPFAHIGYVFLYFYGLERRLLSDAQTSAAAQAETPALLREIERLLAIYGTNHSFRSYAETLLESVRCSQVKGKVYIEPAPDPVRGYARPLTLRVALSQLAADGKPLPADWALSWVMSDIEFYPRTPAERCRKELAEIFQRRYAQAYKEGVKLHQSKRPLRAEYHPASASLRGVSIPMAGLMETEVGAATLAKLRAIVTQASDSLDAYSRWKGRHSDASSQRGAGLLPSELVAARRGSDLRILDTYLASHVACGTLPTVPLVDVLRAWDPSVPNPVDKQDGILLAELLEKMGYGIDPDARLGKWAVTRACALFELDASAPALPTPAYVAAESVLRFAAAVACADGQVSDRERSHIEEHLATVASLSSNDRRRLSARLHRLLSEGQDLKGIRKADLTAYDEADRRALCRFLLALAATDGVVSPAEITVLGKVYGLLGLAVTDLYSEVHEASSGPAAGPVVVRPSKPAKDGFAIPRRQPKPSSFALNEDVLRTLSEDTARVSGLLSRIAAETEDAPQAALVPADTAPGGHLDGPHRLLLEHLAGRDSISTADLKALAESLGLMSIGAIERLNDVSMDQTGEFLLEEVEDTLLIQGAVHKELLS